MPPSPHVQLPLETHRPPTVITQTQTQTITNPSSPLLPLSEPIVLRLRGADPASSLDLLHSPTETSASTSTSRSSQRQRPRHIQWTPETVDNEHLNRKKSKVCCIFHRTRPVGESSSEDDSSSSSSGSDESGSGNDDGRARMVGGNRNAKRRRRCKHEHEHEHEHDDRNEDGDGDERKGNDVDNSSTGRKKNSSRKSARQPSPNAYERMPRHRVEASKQKPPIQ